MTDDKIAEIRARHSRDDRWRNLPSMICPQAHDDRALLLAEVERLRAENERLLQAIGLVTTAVPDMEIDIESPVGMAQRVVAEFKKLREDNERLRAEIERLREVIRTIRARCVELDDSDAVSETLDIATAVLEDEP